MGRVFMKAFSLRFSLLLCSTEEGKKLESSLSVQVVNGVIVLVQRKRNMIGSKMWVGIGGGGWGYRPCFTSAAFSSVSWLQILLLLVLPSSWSWFYRLCFHVFFSKMMTGLVYILPFYLVCVSIYNNTEYGFYM